MHFMDRISLPVSETADGAGMDGSFPTVRMMNNISNGVCTLMETSSLPPQLHYRECMRNHAASIGGHATDGCGEFLPSGEKGTLESLKCAACDCHRNFHRREDPSLPLSRTPDKDRIIPRGKNGSNPGAASNSFPLTSDTPKDLQPPQACVRLMQALNSEGELQLQAEGAEAYSFPYSSPPPRKRFRTKFSVEQKEQMWVFAENVRWRIKKENEAAVREFCAKVGIKRHILKVWMHNNKNTLGSKPPSSSLSPASSHLATISTDPASHLHP